MNEQLFYWVISMSGVIISLLLVVIGFFLTKFIKSVDDMQSSVEALNVAISAFSEKFISNSKEHEVTERRLNEHSRRIDEHEICITRLKEHVL